MQVQIVSLQCKAGSENKSQVLKYPRLKFFGLGDIL